MLVKLNKNVVPVEGEGKKVSETLNITDEQLQSYQKDFDDLTLDIVKSMSGDASSTLKDSGEILERLNEMTPEALLYGAFSALMYICEQNVNPMSQLLNMMQTEEPEDNVPVIQLNPDFKPAA